MLEVLPVHGKQSAGHGGRTEGSAKILRHLERALGQILPAEVQAPVESSAHQWTGRVLKGISVDQVDDGHGQSGVLRLDEAQQRLQPLLIDLDMRVEEDEHIAHGLACTNDPGTNETLALLVFDVPQVVVLQAGTQIPVQMEFQFWKIAVIIHQNNLAQQVAGRAFQHGLNRAHQRHLVLVVEAHDYGGLGQIFRFRGLLAIAHLVPSVWDRPEESYVIGHQRVEGVMLVANVAYVLVLLVAHHTQQFQLLRITGRLGCRRRFASGNAGIWSASDGDPGLVAQLGPWRCVPFVDPPSCRADGAAQAVRVEKQRQQPDDRHQKGAQAAGFAQEALDLHHGSRLDYVVRFPGYLSSYFVTFMMIGIN
uniref:AT04666p n=1 Tax=Drosophila melanogaster TaxID=7227 RepID=Q8T4I4_DROME|nr:AT04666p [Drosophila melanogaster]